MRPISEISLGLGSISALQTATTSSDRAIAPFNGEIVGIAFHTDTLIDAALTLDLFVDEVNQGALLVPNPVLPADSGEIMVPTTKTYVRAGDAIRVETNGQQSGAAIGYLTLILRP